MRISTSIITANSISNVQSSSERYFRAQNVVSTGKRLNKLSDDPSSVPDDLSLRAALDNIEQYKKNLQDARGFLGASDIAVGNAVSVMRNARVMALQGATDGATSENRENLALLVDGLIDALATVANTHYGSRYLFGGQRTTEEPFVQQGESYVYRGGTRANGDANLLIDTAPQQPIVINKPGDDVFAEAFTALKELKANLLYGQPARISVENLPQLDKALESLTATQADFGAKGQQVKATEDRYAIMETEFTTFLSNIEDADIPTAIVELTTAQTAYQAALTASSRSFQQSLLDFLR
jgi:flagellar hook-associated protein 3 FlgL